MLPKPFKTLLINPMLDLEQALSFEFYYQPRPHVVGYGLASHFKKDLQLHPFRIERKSSILLQPFRDGEGTSSLSHHV